MKVVIDPVPGAHGPGRLYALVEEGHVTDVFISTTLYRGFEDACNGQPIENLPRLSSYACGADSLSASLAAVKAIEQQSRTTIQLPESALYLRNLMTGLDFVAQHIMHIYTVFLPSLVSPAMLDSASRLTGGDTDLQAALLAEAQKRYTPYGTGEPAGSLFLEAFRLRRRVHQALATLGGRYPPQMNVVPGGVAKPPTQTGMATVASVVNELKSFMETRLLGDTTLAEWESSISDYPTRVVNNLFQQFNYLPTNEISPNNGWGDLMLSLALGCELCADEYLGLPMSARLGRLGGYPAIDPGGVGFFSDSLFPLPDGGYALPCAGFTPLYEISADAPHEASIDGISEHLKYSYYSTETGDEAVMTPGINRLTPPEDILGIPMDDPEGDSPYSWSTAPRYQNRPCEVGPLARMINMRHPFVMGLCQVLTFQGNSPANVLAREMARIQEMVTVLTCLDEWMEQGSPFDAKSYVTPSIGVNETSHAMQEGPRGTFINWLKTDSSGVISYYHTVSANAWNLSPMDAGGVQGPAELSATYQSPFGGRVGFGANLRSEAGLLDVNQEALEPWGLLFSLRSYAPCFSCAGH